MSYLYVVATPIGNLDDITYRAVKVLKDVDCIACEDTRTTKKLLSHLGIQGKKLLSYHQFNEEKETEHILSLLKGGKSVALVSDAGTPTLSDPGYRLIKRAVEEGIPLVPIPGAFAGAVALSVSGLPTDKFLFLGFLPNKDKQRKEILKEYLPLGITTVIYESPKRVLKTLSAIDEIAPNSDVVVAKELTKIHESFFRGKPVDVIKQLSEDPSIQKGEFVILVYPHIEKKVDEKKVKEEIQKLLKQGVKTGEIAKVISKQFNIPKKQVYQEVLEIKEKQTTGG
ncbi:MAG: 16S rRNA (cytidine(1402)-2'-O)-methyltransferase [Aquificae bacterium]|nr:16S rRNA (cytidine(1402)-2'-O)-methyltransferase [Aquificota bacterium]